MRTCLVCILVLAGLVTQATAQNSAFTRRDVAVGDPNVSYGSTEFSPDWKYLVWTETFADRTINQVQWHCGMNPDTGELIPPDGKGFRAFDTTTWGRATAGRDSQGVFYVGMNRQGQLVLVRPTSATTGTVTILPTPADITRRAVYAADLPEEPGQTGYVFWIKNENEAGGAGDVRNTWVELRYISLTNPSVEVVLQHQNRPPAPSTAWAPLDAAFPRWIRGRAALTSGIRDANGFVQSVEFDFTQGTGAPTPRLVTNDPASKADAFPWTFGNQDILMSGASGGTGNIRIYTRPVGTQFFTPVETITPMVATLIPPVFAQSAERTSFGGRAYVSFQVNPLGGDFNTTTFANTGEIWLTTILQTPQQQWRLSDDSDRAKFENEPYEGRSKVWVFYSSVPKGSPLGSTVIQLRRCDTPLSTVDSGDTESPSVSDAGLSKKKVKRQTDPTVTITWTSSDNTAVTSHDILFADDEVNFSTTVIAGLAGNEQSFTWTVPDSLPKTGTGRIKIIARDAAGNAGEAVSGKLKIK